MNRKILKLAIPNIVSNITVPLLGMVDLALMGHLDSVDYIGAIALGSMIFNFLYWGFGFLRMGTSGFTAQAYGRRDLSESLHTLSRGLIIAVLGAIILIALQYPIQKIAFHFISSEKGVEELARSYFYIRIWAAPATISMYALNGWFIGMQNTRFPMITAIIINVVNMGLSFFFVFGLHLNSNGVALGTLIAQYSGLIVSLILLRKYYVRLFKYFEIEALKKIGALKEFVNVNQDIFLRTLCIIVVFTFFTSSSAAVSKDVLATNTVLLQFFFIFSFFVDGFAYAAEALTGRYMGAGSKTLFRESVKKLFYWGTGIAALFSLMYALFWEPIAYVLTDNPVVLKLASEYAIWVILVPMVSFSSFLWDGIYVGATASKAMRNSMFVATGLIFFPLFFLLKDVYGNHALWIALLGFLLTRSVGQFILAPKAVYRKVKAINNE